MSDSVKTQDDTIQPVTIQPENAAASFEDFWQSYPRRERKERAEAVWQEAVARGISPQDICTAAALYVQRIRSTGTALRYVKLPDNFITATVNTLLAFGADSCKDCDKADRCYNGMVVEPVLDEKLGRSYDETYPCPVLSAGLLAKKKIAAAG